MCDQYEQKWIYRKRKLLICNILLNKKVDFVITIFKLKIMKKILIIFFTIFFLTGCSQYSAMLGPSIKLVETGSVLQAATSYGSSRSLNFVGQSVNEELQAERICQTDHSSEISEIFFERLDRDDNCIFDPMSIYR